MSISRREFLEMSAMLSSFAAINGVSGLASMAHAGGPTDKTKWVKSVCRYCGTGCGLYIGVENGRVVSVKGDTDNHNAGLLCLKGFLLPQIQTAPDRCLHPLIRRNGKLERASWNEALELVASKFSATIKEHGSNSVAFYGSGQALTEETYCANKLFKAGIGSNNVEGNPRLCMASAVGGYVTTYGKDEPMGTYEDIDHADVFLLIGTNTAEAHPIIFQRVVRRKRRNPSVRVIVMDPRRTPTSRIADLHVSFKPGTDLAILNAIVHVIVRDGRVDEKFIENHVTFGQGKKADKTWAAYKAFLMEYTPARAADIAGCSVADIETMARWIGDPNRTFMSMWTMGLNQRTRGVWANNLVHNLHLVTGKIGIPGSTPFSLTGQPNACGGVRDGGGLSHLLPYGRLIKKPEHRAQMEKLWGIPSGTIANAPGQHTVNMFRGLESGAIKAIYIMCTNPGQSLPNVERYRAALQKEGAFVVVVDAYHPTRTTELADVVLPAALWAEKEGVYGSAERRYQLLEKAIDPPGEAKPDFRILCELAAKLGHGKLLPFSSPEQVWKEVLSLCKGTIYDFTGMTRDRLREAHGLMWPLPSAGHQGTKLRYVRGEDPLVPANAAHRIEFYGRPDKRAVIWLRPHNDPAEVPDKEFPFYYTTGRVIEHWHTGTMTMKCKELRQANAEATAEVHPDDAKRMSIKTGDMVRIRSRRGKLELRAKVSTSGRAGLVFVHMHDPERLCNRPTIDAFDPGSKQPEFKICAVALEKA